MTSSFLKNVGDRCLVTLIPGDYANNIGSALTRIVNHLNLPIGFEELQVSNNAPTTYRNAIESIQKNRIGLKGLIASSSKGLSSLNVALRQGLHLSAQVSLVKSIPTSQARFKNLNFIIIRENLEGEYSGLEHAAVPGVVEALKLTSRGRSERLARFAFEYAIKNARKRITCIHKANIMKLTDGLFLKTFREVSESYKQSGIVADDMIVDNASMQLVSNPFQFDVVITPNLYGAIAINIAAGLLGTQEVLTAVNMGTDISLYETTTRPGASTLEHSTALLFAMSQLIRDVGFSEQSRKLESALVDINQGAHSSLDEMTDKILSKI